MLMAADYKAMDKALDAKIALLKNPRDLRLRIIRNVLYDNEWNIQNEQITLEDLSLELLNALETGDI